MLLCVINGTSRLDHAQGFFMASLLDPETLPEKIAAGEISRSKILALHRNLVDRLELVQGDKLRLANDLIAVIRTTYVPPLQSEYLFMGYCPGADIRRRRDEIWIKDGFCNFAFVSSKHQVKNFFKVLPGDLVILKKREKFGKTMLIHAHGKVTSLESNKDGMRYLKVDWRQPQSPLEVPLMGCNSTVNFRTLRQVEDAQTDEFWKWLAEPSAL